MKLSSFLLRSTSVGLLGLCISALHCGGGVSARCEEHIACEGGNDADQAACETELDTLQEVADLKGCSAEWDDLFDCQEEKLRCNNNLYQIDDDQCLKEKDRYSKCIE